MVRLPTPLRHAAPPAFEFVVEDPHAHRSPRAQHLIASDPFYEATAERLKAYKFRPAVEPASSSEPFTPPLEHFFFTPADSLVAYGEMHFEEKLERFRAAAREVDEAEGQLVDVLSGPSWRKVWAKTKRAIARAPVRYRLDFASLSPSSSSGATLPLSRTPPPSTRAPSTTASPSHSNVSRRQRPSLFTFRSTSSSTSSATTAVDSLLSASSRSTQASDDSMAAVCGADA